MELAPAGGIVVRLRGLPTKATKEDVAEFLQEWQPRAVYLAFTTRRSTGEAYVVFDTREQAEGACSKDKDIFGPRFGERYVRVSIQEDTTPADLQSLEGAPKARAGPLASKPRRPHQKMDSVVKVTGLPCGISTAEVLQLFWGWQVKLGRTFLRSEAFIDFEHAEHAGIAVSTRHGTTITTSTGMFQLAVQKASKAEWDVVVEAARSGGGGDGIVRVRGLPPRAAAGDVLAFFQGYHVKQGGVHLQPCANGAHHRLALVEFDSPEEARRAMERDRHRLGEAFGDSCCTLELISRAEFEQELQRFAVPGSGGNGNSSSSGGTAVGGTATASLTPASLAGMRSGSVFSMHPSMPTGSMNMSLTGMPPLGMGLPGMGILPQAAAAAAGFMTPGLPHIPPAAMLPGAGFGAGSLFPHLHPGWPPGAMPAAAAAFGAAPGLSGMFQAPAWPGMPPPVQPNPASARYMVQDLTTGQKVFLDPRFNLSGYGALPPGLASCSVVATVGTTFGATATGPAGSQQTQTQSGAAGGSGDTPAGEASETSNGLKPRRGRGGAGGAGAGTGTSTGFAAGQSSGPTPVGGVPGSGNGNGSSRNGYSVAAAGAMAGAAAGNGAGTSVQRHADAMAAAVGDGQGSSEQAGGQEAAAQPHAPKHRHSHHHHHHSHHHHHHYRARGSGRGNGNGGSSGDEGRTNGGSGGGSNDGGSNDGSGAEDPGRNGRGSNNKAAGDNSSGNDATGGAAPEGGSSGEGSGADDGATARTSGDGFSRQAGPGEGELGGLADMEEDAAAPGLAAAAQLQLQQDNPPLAAPPQPQRQQVGQQQGKGSPAAAPPGPHIKDHVHAHSPDDPAALQSEAVQQPPQKRARDH
ncbi:hypothetical protein ABPG75_001424 [Micractinium tetrahymenae]